VARGNLGDIALDAIYLLKKDFNLFVDHVFNVA